MRRNAWSGVGLLCLLAAGRPVRCDQGPGPTAAPLPAPASRLTLERIYGGPPIHAPLPGWSWRPGHAQLVRQQGPELLAEDPVTGERRTLLNLRSLEALVEHPGRDEEPVGRRGVPNLLWTQDGRALCALVKGQRVWVPLEGGAPRRLTPDGGPARTDVQLSPGGRWLSYAAGDDLWLVPTDGTEAVRIAGGSPDVLHARLDWVYPEELDLEHAAWWSPDEQRLAFLRLDESGVPTYDVPDTLDPRAVPRRIRYPRAGEANPRASVWVCGAKGAAEGAPVRLDLGPAAEAEYVVRVAWTPDARSVLVVTLDRPQQHLVLRACDPVTGQGTVVLEERDPAWIEAPPAPRFVDGQRFLWKDVQGRWKLQRLHGRKLVGDSLALHPEGFVAGGVLLAGGLLAGDDAPAAAPSVAQAAVLNRLLVEGHPAGGRQRRLWRAAVEGRPLTPWLPDIEGALDVDVDGTGRHALVRRSTALRPPVLEVRSLLDGALTRTLDDGLSDAYRALELPEVEEGSTPTEGGQVLWRLWKPRTLVEGRRYPLIVTVYGGPGSRTVEDRFGSGPYLPALWVQQGFLVLQADGRGTGGQGAAFERAVRGRLTEKEVEDQVLAVKAITARPYADPERVGIFGWSYGGSMAAAALLRAPGVFRAGVAAAAVTDWRFYDTIYTERYMGLPEANPLGYRETALATHAAALKGRLLLLHGLGDDNVHPQNTLVLVEALIQAGRTGFDWTLYANRGHGLGGASLDVFRRITGWFDEHLAPR